MVKHNKENIVVNIQSEKLNTSEIVRKVPEITLMFWIIKIFATTLGETGGDAVTMSMNLGYLTGTMIFTLFFVIMVVTQIREKKLNSYVYWITIVATTTLGTTLADFCTRSLGIGYAGGSSLLLVLLTGSLFIWKRTMGSVSVDAVNSPKSIHLDQNIPLALFWAAFILTRPVGAVVGGFLDKPVSIGGLALSRYSASTVLFICIMALIFLSEQRAKQVISSNYSTYQNVSNDIDFNENEESDK
jgi:uncharacterized membrane-anchored protein